MIQILLSMLFLLSLLLCAPYPVSAEDQISVRLFYAHRPVRKLSIEAPAEILQPFDRSFTAGVLKVEAAGQKLLIQMPYSNEKIILGQKLCLRGTSSRGTWF